MPRGKKQFSLRHLHLPTPRMQSSQECRVEELDSTYASLWWENRRTSVFAMDSIAFSTSELCSKAPNRLIERTTVKDIHENGLVERWFRSCLQRSSDIFLGALNSKDSDHFLLFVLNPRLFCFLGKSHSILILPVQHQDSQPDSLSAPCWCCESSAIFLSVTFWAPNYSEKSVQCLWAFKPCLWSPWNVICRPHLSGFDWRKQQVSWSHQILSRIIVGTWKSLR